MDDGRDADSVRITVVGQGKIGLPLAVQFARSGHEVCGADVNSRTVEAVNNGIAPQYYVEDDHEAIIPKEIYMKVQEELVRRRNVQASPSGKKRMYSCTHCFSQMVVCGSCGEVFRRIHWNNHGCRYL